MIVSPFGGIAPSTPAGHSPLFVMTELMKLPAGLPAEVAQAGYSSKELNILSRCWDKSNIISKEKTDLAFELHTLKQEMDANDPNYHEKGGGNGTKSRFWAAFEAGHLPYQGDAGRASIYTAVAAVEWLQGQALSKGLDSDLRRLAPSTIVEISKLTPENQQIVFNSIGTSQFIGVAAVRLLANVTDKNLRDKLEDWVGGNADKAITPKTIRVLQAEVEAEQVPAGQQTVDVPPQPQKPWGETTYDGPPQRTAAERQQIREDAAARGRRAEVRRTLQQSEQAEADALKADQKAYSDSLQGMLQAMQQLKTTVSRICARKGSLYLDELRSLQGFMGINYVENDVAELQRAYTLLRQIVEFVTSREGPQTIDWETINVEAK